jgi:hypothetical protein
LEAALKEYAEILNSYKEAKLLVVAPNIKIARTYFDYLARRGLPARIATSDDSLRARRNIEDYKRGVYRILVTVAMAYEGLNVPEISVICCLSHIRSVPWLEQCFARANRVRPGKPRPVVYAPADWAFKKAVSMIENEQLSPLKNSEEQAELSTAGEKEQGKGNGGARPWIIPIRSAANAGDPFGAPAPANLAPWLLPSEAEKILRKNINGVVSAFLDRQPHGNKKAHSKLLYRRMRLVVDKPVSEMNQGELERVWVWLRKNTGGLNGH